MSFSFGFFRFLTYGNLFVVGFFLLIALMAMLIVPNMSALVMTMLTIGVVFIHNIMCLHLQKAVKDPEVTISSNFYTFIIILSVLCFLYSIYIFFSAASVMLVSEADFIKMVETNNFQGGEKPPREMIAAIRKITFALIAIHGLAIAGNAVLSLLFLKKWKKEQAEREEEETTLDI
jgi:hypothetical protein